MKKEDTCIDKKKERYLKNIYQEILVNSEGINRLKKKKTKENMLKEKKNMK